MRNDRFYYLIELPKDAQGKRIWTVAKIAETIYCGRAHVNEVLNNKPGKGFQTRRKLVRFFKSNFTMWRDILRALGWSEDGSIVSRGTSDVEQKQTHA